MSKKPRYFETNVPQGYFKFYSQCRLGPLPACFYFLWICQVIHTNINLTFWSVCDIFYHSLTVKDRICQCLAARWSRLEVQAFLLIFSHSCSYTFCSIFFTLLGSNFLPLRNLYKIPKIENIISFFYRILKDSKILSPGVTFRGNLALRQNKNISCFKRFCVDFWKFSKNLTSFKFFAKPANSIYSIKCFVHFSD